jgi:hypothetical protein
METKQTFKEWMIETIPESIEDIAEHGCSGGYPELTYYRDTVALYEEYEDEIWDALDEDYKSFGMKNSLELIASFGGAGDVGSNEQFQNLLTWYLAERTAREIVDNHEVPEIKEVS